jgi:hypothetical protein
MDKIMKIVLGIFVVILVVFVSVFSYSVFVEKAYQSSLTSSYTYHSTITTDSMLSNVTLFIPVPADASGNSPVIARISDKSLTGVPSGWQTTVLDAGKSTYVKMTTPVIAVPAGTSGKNPYTINISVQVTSNGHINTLTPIDHDVIFRPVQDLHSATCPQDIANLPGTPQCYEYLTAVYADYAAAPGASVTIRSTLVGKNDWRIFNPEYNEYQNSLFVLMFGENHGWTTTRASLESGIGYYNAPATP